MKNKTILAFAAAAILAVGCSKEHDGSGGGFSGEVSDAVKIAFEAKYPGAQNV